jgi:hypothetical protein
MHLRASPLSALSIAASAGPAQAGKHPRQADIPWLPGGCLLRSGMILDALGYPALESCFIARFFRKSGVHFSDLAS